MNPHDQNAPEEELAEASRRAAEARRIVEDYANDLRAIIEALEVVQLTRSELRIWPRPPKQI